LVFGAVERDASGHRWGDVLTPILCAVPVDIDVQTVSLNVVALVALGVVVVPDDLLPRTVVLILKLEDEPRDDPADVTDAETNAEVGVRTSVYSRSYLREPPGQS
jgi:hypothetical protein